MLCLYFTLINTFRKIEYCLLTIILLSDIIGSNTTTLIGMHYVQDRFVILDQLMPINSEHIADLSNFLKLFVDIPVIHNTLCIEKPFIVTSTSTLHLADIGAPY